MGRAEQSEDVWRTAERDLTRRGSVTVRRCAGLFAVLSLAGCTVGPDYEPPELDVPAEWSAASPDSQVDASAELAVWWERFEDPQLTALVQRAVRGNLDVTV